MCTAPKICLFSVRHVRAGFEDLRAWSTPLLRDIRYTENPYYFYVLSFIEKYANLWESSIENFQRSSKSWIENSFIWNFIERCSSNPANAS